MIYRNGYGPIDRFCAKHPRFGISNLMLYIVIGQVAVFILDLFFRGMLSSYWLPFSRDLILHGQVWRLVTFIFLPSDSWNGSGVRPGLPCSTCQGWCCPSSPA